MRVSFNLSGGGATGIAGGVFTIVAGLIFFAIFYTFSAQFTERRHWRETPAAVVAVGEIVRERDAGYRAEVRYRYHGDDREFTGQDDKSGDYATLLAFTAAHPPGAALICYVNPKNPAESSLYRPAGWVLLFPFGPLIFVLIGAGQLIFAIRRRRRKNTAPPPEKLGRLGNKPTRFFVALLLVVFGALFCTPVWFLTVKPTLLQRQARSWPEASAVVLDSRVAVNRDSDGDTYRAEITYSYTWEGREHVSDRYNFSTVYTSGRQGKEEIAKAYPPGRRFRCFVNPADPAYAVVSREVDSAKWFGLIFGIAGLGIFGLGLYVGFHREKIAGTAIPGGRAAEFQPKRTFHSPAVSIIVALAFCGGIGYGLWFCLDRRIWPGAVILGAAALIALFLVATGLPNTFRRRAQLRFDGPARLGERLTIRYDAPGAPGAKELLVLLSGKFSYTRKSGSGKHDNESVLAEPIHYKILHREAYPTQAAGEFTATLPADTLPSFREGTNEVAWKIMVVTVRGRFRYGFDRFKVNILPAKGDADV